MTAADLRSPLIANAVAYFVSVGWSPAQAAGIVANLYAESRLRPDAVGDGGKAYGVAQWHPDRQQRFAAIFGKDIVGSSIDEQLAFVHAELGGAEKAAGEALRACVTAAEAGACVSKKYERPADREGDAAKRAALATEIAGEPPAVSTPQPPLDVGTERPVSEAPAVQINPIRSIPIVGPLLIPLLTALQAVPDILKLFAGKNPSEVAQRNTALASKVAEVAVDALKATGPGDAMDKLANDPTAVQTVAAAVKADPGLQLMLVEAGGGGIAGARSFVAQIAGTPQGAAMTSILRVVTYWVLGFLTFANVAGFALAGVMVWLKLGEWQQITSTLIQADINAAFAAIGFWLGSSLAKGGTPAVNVRSDP